MFEYFAAISEINFHCDVQREKTPWDQASRLPRHGGADSDAQKNRCRFLLPKRKNASRRIGRLASSITLANAYLALRSVANVSAHAFSNLYPTPFTVLIYFGFLGSSSIFSLNLEICIFTVLLLPSR